MDQVEDDGGEAEDRDEGDHDHCNRDELADVGGSATQLLVERHGEMATVEREQRETVDDAEDDVDDRQDQCDRCEPDFVCLSTDLDDSHETDRANFVVDFTAEDPTEELTERVELQEPAERDEREPNSFGELRAGVDDCLADSELFGQRCRGDPEEPARLTVHDPRPQLTAEHELFVASLDGDVDDLTCPRFQGSDQILPFGCRVAVDREDRVVRLEAELCGRGCHTVLVLDDHRSDGRGLDELTVDDDRLSLGQRQSEEDEVGDDEVGGHARQDDERLRPERLRPVRPVFVLGIHLVDGAHPDDLDVGTERDRLDAVFGLTALERPDPGSEAEEELGDLHPGRLGREIVAGLVGDDEEHECDEDDDSAGHGQVSPGDGWL